MLTAILLAVTLSAPGDIHRCATPDGSVHYQELPCATAARKTAASTNLSGKANSEQALHRWLTETKKTVPTSRRRAPSSAGQNQWQGQVSSSAGELPPRPTSETALASCSALFLECAHDNDQRMDRCVNQISQCGQGSAAACCHTAFVQRYQLMRQAGTPRKLAVRDALLRD